MGAGSLLPAGAWRVVTSIVVVPDGSPGGPTTRSGVTITAALAWLILGCSSVSLTASGALLAVTSRAAGVAGLLPGQLPALTRSILPVLCRLSIASISRTCHGFELATQPRNLIERPGRVILSCAGLSWLCLAHTSLGLLNLLVQFCESLRDLVFGAVRIRIDPGPQPVSCPLHVVVKIGLVHLSQSIT